MNKAVKIEPVLPVLADVSISISELKKNPSAAIEAAKKEQVAILNRNKAVGYIISPEVWDHVLDVFDDLKIAREMEAMADEDFDDAVEVSLDDLL